MPAFCQRLALLLLACGLAALAHAQQPEPTALPRPDDAPIRFDHLTNTDGLSQMSVYAILQDRRGFMWFGTQSEINRYDGYEFKIYQNDPDDLNSLGTGGGRGLLEDRNGMIWVQGGNRLDRLDPVTETFTHFRHHPDDPTSLSNGRLGALYEDRQGTLWVGSWGLNRYDPQTESFTHVYPDSQYVVFDPSEAPDNRGNEILAIHEDRQGMMWLGTGGGLFRYDPVAGTFTRYRHDPDDPTSLSHDRVTALYEDAQGTLWVGAWGLNRFDPVTETFARFYIDPEAMGPGPGGIGTGETLYVNRIRAIYEDRQGMLWVGSGQSSTSRSGGGLNRFERESGRFMRYLHDPTDPGSLSSNSVWAIYEDRQGVLWVGTNTGGLNRFDRSAQLFSHYRHDPRDQNSLQGGPVGSILLDPDDVLWIGTSGGVLNRLDRKTGRVTHYRNDPDDPYSLGTGVLNAIHRDRVGRLWIGTRRNGLNLLDEATGRFTRYEHDPGNPSSISSNNIRVIYEDRSGRLWIGAWGGGLNHFDPKLGTFTRYQQDPDDPNSLHSNFLYSILEDEDGLLWIGHLRGGLDHFNPASGHATHFESNPGDPHSLSNNVFTLYERPQEPGILWIGTGGGGLNRFDTKTGRATHFTVQNSDLPDNTVYCVLGDDAAGRLWISTNRGIARLETETEQFSTFGLDDGLQDLEFDIFSCHQGLNGELFFGGRGGVNTIRPGDVFDNPNPPQVALTGLRLFNEPVLPGPDSPLKTSLLESEALTLAHNQNDITLEYVGLHFRHPQLNRYQYLLEGYDEGWRDVGTRREATYTGLPPGAYTFRMKAANSDDVWNEEGATLAITILPPWWRTWWAYLLYGLLLVGGVFAVDRFQRRRLLRKEREKSLLREKELRAEAAEAMANYLQSENLRQTQELDAARELQLSMLPETMPEHPTVELAAFMETATEVGGDYYDFDLSDDGTLTLAIGDATGHGTKAGTMVTAAKSLFIHCAREPDLAAVLSQATETLKRMGLPKLYMALALVRLQDHTLELAGAGMPPALVYRAATQQVETVSLKGMPLGGPVAFPYRKTSVTLSPGDTVVLMSDGFPELFNAEGEMLGYERAVTVFEEVASRSPEEIITHFTETGETWSNGRALDDDVTFVVMKMKASTGDQGAEAV